MSDINADKLALRAQLRNKLATLDGARKQAYDRALLDNLLALPVLREASSCFCFISHGQEVDTHTLIDTLRHGGQEVYVPKIMAGGSMIAVAFPGWQRLHRGQLGILSPRSCTAAKTAINVCITPGLGFTKNGARIGYGKGYYDRWLRAHPDCKRIAVAYEAQLLQTVPVTDNDEFVQQIVTEERVIDCQQ